MAHFVIVFVGKIKEPFAQLYDSYAKRLPLETIVLKSRKQLLAYAKRPFILVSEKGKSFDSLTFAQWIKEQSLPLVFLVGDDEGFPQEILQSPQRIFTLSLSPLTFPHDLAKILLVEQLYRAMTIIQKKSYHK